jgi:ArsR family metal-binding transcriptional regulator
MARAVIKFAGDIKPLMRQLSLQIPGCSYNREADLLSFNKDDIAIVINSDLITIYAEEETEAKSVFESLKLALERIEKSFNLNTE